MKPAEDFLRELAANDLDGHGCYVVDWSSIAATLPELYREWSLAYTGTALDVVLQPWLESRGRWTGRGFACIVFRERIGSWLDVLGIVTHELAHWLSDPRTIEPQRQGSEALTSEMADWCALTVEPSPAWLSHELPFVRAAAVLSHRAANVLESIRPSMLRFSRQYTGVPESNWLAALGSEIDHSGSIRELVKTDAPAEAARLWQYATE